MKQSFMECFLEKALHHPGLSYTIAHPNSPDLGLSAFPQSQKSPLKGGLDKSPNVCLFLKLKLPSKKRFQTADEIKENMPLGSWHWLQKSTL